MGSIEIKAIKDNGMEVMFRHAKTKLTRLNEPEEFQGNRQFGAFLVLDPADAGIEEFKEEALNLQDRVMKVRGDKKANKNNPWQNDLTKDGDDLVESGNVAFKTKARADKKPEIPFFDAAGNPMRPEERPNIGDGSVVNLSAWVSISKSPTFGATIAIWINAVQPVTVQDSGGGYGFGEEAEADYAGAQQAEASANPF